MRWPWTRREPEERQTAQGYTAALTAALDAGAEGSAQGNPLASGALEAAATLYSSCFAAAALDPPVPALTPAVRALIARNLIRRGEDHHRIYVRGGRVVLEPVGFAYAHGNGPDPMAWAYNATLYGPTDSRHEWVPAASMLHCRHSVDASRPWLGVPAWSWAASAGRAAGYSESRLADEASGAVGRVIPLPAAMSGAGDTDKLSQFKADFAGMRGKATFVPTTADGGGEGRAAAPPRDWKQERIGPAPDEGLLTLRSDASAALLAACGVPSALVDPSADGTAQREAWRRFALSSLAGIAHVVEEELERKLDMKITFDFRQLWAWDMAGRASSFKAMVAGGMAIERAAALSGLVAMEGDA